MALASLIGFIRTALTILLLLYVFRLLVRLFFPFLLKKTLEKHKHSFNKTKNTSDNQKKTKKKVGEYIDFEEID